MNTRAAMTGAALVGLAAGSAAAQAINFDADLDGLLPSNGYGGGAARPGVWTSQNGIVDIAGNPTSLYIFDSGILGGSAPVAGAGADDGALMNDFFSMSSSAFFSLGNLAQGKYRVYVYMWQGAIEQKSGYTDCRVIVQGNTPSNTLLSTTYTKDWPGQQVYKTTYDYVDIQISGSAALLFTPGFKDFCIIQGFQIVPIPGPASLAAFAPLGLVAARRKRSR